MGYITPIDYNEGFNVIPTTRLVHGRPLYVPLTSFPVTPVDYPPLSFVIIGGLSYFTGSILLTGRVVSLVSLLFVSYLVYGIIDNFTLKKSAALLGTLLWLALVVRMADNYIGMYDPQMLAHIFSLGAIYLYSKWVDEITVQKTCMLAFLCCFALFIKHSLIAAPIALAITLFFSNRGLFGTFALAGIIISSLMLFGSWLYAGEYIFSNNFIDFELARSVSNWRMFKEIAYLFCIKFVFVLFLPFVMLLFKFKFQKRWLCPLIYFLISFLSGAYFVRGAGIDKNAWFNFFIAAAIVFGLLAAESTKLKVFWIRSLVYGILASCLLPFSINLKASLEQVLNYDRLKQEEEAYQKDVKLLQSIPGPALFEEPLLGFDAGKELLFESFDGSQQIVSGRIPERILTDPIHEKYFGAIVLNFDLEKRLSRFSKATIDPLKPKTTLTERWTDNTLKAISDNYELLDPKRPRYHFLYLPRKT